jgi:signal transduction histidine kinase
MRTRDAGAEKLLTDVVHDLSQPLGTIELVAYLLSTSLPDAPPQLREYIQIIQRQADAAISILHEAGTSLASARTQRDDAGHLDFTNSATAAVT